MAETRKSFGTSVSRAIPDEFLPGSVKTGVTKALFQGGGIPEYLLEELIASIGVRAERMYVYGRDHYTHGLPSGQYITKAEDIDVAVGTVLLGVEGAAVDIDYLHHGAPNNLHIGWLTLMATHAYVPATNQLGWLTITKGTPVYLHDMVVVVPEALLPTIDASSLEQWGIAACAGYTPLRQHSTAETRAMIQPSGVRGELTAVTELIRVKYVWVEAGVVQHDFFEIPITGYDDSADYYHVRYRVAGVAKYWMYRDGAGTYPTLDTLFDEAPLSGGSFFPFAYFRHNHASEIADTSTESYRTTKKLVKYLGMDYDQVAQAIDDNPDIGGVKQAVLMMAVPANTTEPIEQRYLWDFFNELFLASSVEHQYRSEEEATAYALSTEQLGLRSPGIVIQDTRFKMSLDNLGIYKRRKAGVIGAIGEHSSSLSSENLPYDITLENEVGTYISQYYFNLTKHVYRRQISAGFYDEIQVLGLRTLFNILGSYTSIGLGEDRILLIPLDRSITANYSIPDKETLYARSLHFVFNSFITTKLAWYESSLFQVILLVVAVVITVYSFGADGGGAIGAALAAGAYGTAAYLVLVYLVEVLIFKALFRLFVKELGIEAAFVIAIIAAVLGVADAMSSGSVAGAPFAADLLMVSTGITSAIGSQLQSDMRDLLQQATEADTVQKEQLKLLDTAKDLLDNRSMLSPFVIFGEKPEDFYNRTIHSGNIGVVGIDAISSFVDQALRLPELNDTVGDTA